MKRYKVPSEKLEERVIDLVARVMMRASVILEAHAEQERRDAEHFIAWWNAHNLATSLTAVARGETADGDDLHEGYSIA